MFSLARSLVFALLAFLQPSYADYYIDDTNSTLYYSTSAEVWGAFNASTILTLLLPNGTYMPVNPYACYNNTYRYAACRSSDNCILSIPFTGSGITIYVYQSGPIGINASFDVDGDHCQTRVLNAPPAPNYAIANVSMFNIQQLTSGPHTASLTVNDIFGSYSGMIWDYAYVNETLVAAPETTTSASSTSPTYSSSTSSSHSWDTGTIVAVVLGAIALIVIGVIAALFLQRKKRRNATMLTSEEDLRPASFDSRYPGIPISRSTTKHSTSSSFTPLMSNASLEQVSGPNVIASFPSIQGSSSTGQDRQQLLGLSDTESLLGQALPDDDHPASSSTMPQSNTPQSFIVAQAMERVMERYFPDRRLANQNADIRGWQEGLSRTNSYAATALSPIN